MVKTNRSEGEHEEEIEKTHPYQIALMWLLWNDGAQVGAASAYSWCSTGKSFGFTGALIGTITELARLAATVNVDYSQN